MIKSRTQLKNEALALQELGEQLVELNAKQLAQLELPPLLIEAINTLKNITTRAAKRRQSQYVGKLMRTIDPEPIKEFLAGLNNTSQRKAAEFQMLEKWRARLLNEGKMALTEYVNLNKHADVQKLRQLIAAANQDPASIKSKTAARALFRYLKEIHDTNTINLT